MGALHYPTQKCRHHWVLHGTFKTRSGHFNRFRCVHCGAFNSFFKGSAQ